MQFEIKNRWTNEVIITAEAETLKEACKKNKTDLGAANLVAANLEGANLNSAYLVAANLVDANLVDADLGGANLEGAKIKITQKEELLKALRIEIEE
jgi:uncharacterized protein YjbI with pentapeptide repeats